MQSPTSSPLSSPLSSPTASLKEIPAVSITVLPNKKPATARHLAISAVAILALVVAAAAAIALCTLAGFAFSASILNGLLLLHAAGIVGLFIMAVAIPQAIKYCKKTHHDLHPAPAA